MFCFVSVCNGCSLKNLEKKFLLIGDTKHSDISDCM